MESKDSDYESVYYPPWQYSPIFGPNPPTYGFNPQGWTPVNYRPPTAFKSHSTERLNCPRFVQPPVYSFRSPNPSPVHTPSGSPVMNRSIRFTPSPSPARNVRRMPPPPPLPVHPATSKPPLPRQRPPLLKSKTVDHPPDYLPPESCSHRSFDDLRKITNDGSIGHWNTARMDMSSKIPSLDSLYEQLKAFAASPQTHPPPRVDALLAQLNVSARNPPKVKIGHRIHEKIGPVVTFMDKIQHFCSGTHPEVPRSGTLLRFQVESFTGRQHFDLERFQGARFWNISSIQLKVKILGNFLALEHTQSPRYLRFSLHVGTFWNIFVNFDLFLEQIDFEVWKFV